MWNNPLDLICSLLEHHYFQMLDVEKCHDYSLEELPQNVRILPFMAELTG